MHLSFSPCPNDTFIFDALVHGRLNTQGLVLDWSMADVEELNIKASEGIPEITKLSFSAWVDLVETYILLDAGAAMGFGTGPLLIAREHIPHDELTNAIIAIPGVHTTANFLLSFFNADLRNRKEFLFSSIEDALLNGEADAGVIIHENRFTFEEKGLVLIQDLGAYWESRTASPVPLGAIAAKRNLGLPALKLLNQLMKESVIAARKNPAMTDEFVRQNAQTMDPSVMKKHIHLYVNDFTEELGESGKSCVRNFLKEAERQGKTGSDWQHLPLFVSEL